MITYLKGDATVMRPDPSVLLHICNNRGGWGAGFVTAVSARWPHVEAEYREWAEQYLHNHAIWLGCVQFVPVSRDSWVVNMVAQDGYRTRDVSVPLSYPSLLVCLQRVRCQINEFSRVLKCLNRPDQFLVQMPRIGCGLAGGTWGRVEPLIRETLGDLDVVVYDI